LQPIKVADAADVTVAWSLLDHVTTLQPGLSRSRPSGEDQGRFRGNPDGAAWVVWRMLVASPMKGTVMSTSETQSASIKELHRSRDDRILAGVAGGLGRYFDLSPAFFRIGFAILTLVGGAGILLYVAAWLVIPDEGESDSIVSEALRRHRDRPWLLAGVGLVGIALVSLFAQADFWPNSGFAWILLLLGGLAIVFAQRRPSNGTPPADAATPVAPSVATPAATPTARPRQPSLLLPGLGVLLAAAGVLALLDAFGVDVRWDVALAVGAIGTGVAVVAGVALRRRTGGLVVVGLVLAALAVAVSAVDVRLEGPIGTRVYSPVEASDLKHDYDISVGDLKLNLSNAALAAGDTEVDANVGIGELRVIVPDDVSVDVDASASAGEVTVFGRSESGVDADLSEKIGVPGSDRTLRIDAHVGLGDVIVETP
jgi:phage shock protein PspC (stress-responsive transcriptional regulator)